MAKKKNFQIDVGIACIYKDGKYLAQTRPEGKSFVGLFEFPGGKREKGESFRACVEREIKEEIGVEISIQRYFYEEICLFKKIKLRLRFYLAKIEKGEPAALENQELKWIAPVDFFTEKFLPTNHKALKKLQEREGISV